MWAASKASHGYLAINALQVRGDNHAGKTKLSGQRKSLLKQLGGKEGLGCDVFRSQWAKKAIGLN